MSRVITLMMAMAWSSVQAGTIARSTLQLPDLEPPPLAEARWVAKHMRVNGLPMTLKTFHSRLAPDDVLQHYERWARARGTHETHRARNGEWQVLAIRNTKYFVTIQVRASAAASIGTIAVSADPASAAADVNTRFPLPPSVHIATLQQYEDRDIQAEHIGLVSTRAPHVEAALFRSLLEREGWRLIRDGATKKTVGGHMLEVQKGAQHAQLTFLPDRLRPSTTAIVIVWRKE